ERTLAGGLRLQRDSRASKKALLNLDEAQRELVRLVLAVERMHNSRKMTSEKKTQVARTILHLHVSFVRAVRILSRARHPIALAARHEYLKADGDNRKSAAVEDSMASETARNAEGHVDGVADSEEVGDKIAKEEAEDFQDGEGQRDGQNIGVDVKDNAHGTPLSEEVFHDTAPKADEEIAGEIHEKADENADENVGACFVLVDFRDNDDSVKEVDGTTQDGEGKAKTECVDVDDAEAGNVVNDAVGAEDEKSIEEASDSKAEK
ncbi:hypothetical protein MTO96_050071, partial [Rhipicephalus appendiculatus]